MWHNLYANPFTKVLVLVGCQVISKILGIGHSEINWKEYKHVQYGQRSCLQSDSSEKQAILYGASKMHKKLIVGTSCVYNWTYMMVDMGIDNIVHNDKEPVQAKIFNAWIQYWESNILITRDQENELQLFQKYKKIRFFDDEENQIYMIAPENLEFKGPTRRNEQYCVVGQTHDQRDGGDLDLLISIEINDDFMALIKLVEQDPDLRMKLFIQKLMMIARLQIVTKRKIIMIMPPRHHMMVKI